MSSPWSWTAHIASRLTFNPVVVSDNFQLPVNYCIPQPDRYVRVDNVNVVSVLRILCRAIVAYLRSMLTSTTSHRGAHSLPRSTLISTV
ncbi:hypothetical protein Cob_v009590 [Colletotrichum orbiculare MAFF 240422]|uniref:Uncharacterized protein n=1 Tax=Colletotrichum orbiculare (strain 104-T / ATCC 96160 / CBS 514.97 / LARS 414 / MAFF 240422) TaxID=1213857 RepID=A0A484FHJ9_COLOR|nr:hypothetical protein Cob_v009590 [Colletotrichum orbiculare MAFF 240422]